MVEEVGERRLEVWSSAVAEFELVAKRWREHGGSGSFEDADPAIPEAANVVSRNGEAADVGERWRTHAIGPLRGSNPAHEHASSGRIRPADSRRQVRAGLGQHNAGNAPPAAHRIRKAASVSRVLL